MANLHILHPLAGSLWIQGRDQTARTLQIIDPQTDSKSVLGNQLAGQTPADTNVAKVIHNGAENVPAACRSSGKTG
jgi:hypothetical protein